MKMNPESYSEGWAPEPGYDAGTRHYFRNGVSLCGKYSEKGLVRPHTQGDSCNDENCGWCADELYREDESNVMYHTYKTIKFRRKIKTLSGEKEVVVWVDYCMRCGQVKDRGY